MRTYKCAIIVTSCISLILFSLVYVDWLFLVFIIPLFLFLFIGVISFYNKEIDIDLIRSVSNIKIFENDEIEVKITIRNKGDDLQFLEIYDELPLKVKLIGGSNYGLIDFKKEEEITITYKISCPLRGQHHLGPFKIRIKDFFGMFYRDKEIGEKTFITVIPPIEDIKDISISAKPHIYPGIMQAKHAGIGTEFFGIRDYASGDSFKKINWKSFARFNKPMVNEYELESTTDVILVVDARGIQSIGTIKQNPLEYNIKASVSIASHFLKRRDRVGLITYGQAQGNLTWIYPESGKKQLYKIIEELVSLEASGNFPFNGVVYRSIAHMLPKRALIIFASSLEGDWSIPKGIDRLIAYGYKVLIISPSQIDIEYSLSRGDENSKLAYKILSLQRKNYIARLKDKGVRIVDWNPTMPLSLSLKEVEKYLIRR